MNEIFLILGTAFSSSNDQAGSLLHTGKLRTPSFRWLIKIKSYTIL